MCEAAPAILTYQDNLAEVFPTSVNLGNVASPGHFADGHRSGHNCATTPGGQESPLVDPSTGRLVAYTPQWVHAGDRGHPDRLTRANMRNRVLMGPRARHVRYVISHDDGDIYYPEWRGGGVDHGASASGILSTHLSMTPFGAASRDNWLQRTMTPADRRAIERLARDAAEGRRLLEVRRPLMRGRGVHELQVVLNRPVGLPYGHGTARAVRDLQAFFGAEPTGKVNRATWELVLFIYIAHGFGF